MAVLTMKPNTIQVLHVSEGYVADNGDFIAGSTQWGCEHKCDVVPAGTANEIDFGDGLVKKFSFVCYLAPDCREYQIDERVKITRYGKVYELEVKDFKRYQHQAKLWVG